MAQNLFIHSNINNLNPEELPLTVMFHISNGAGDTDLQRSYTVNGGFWEDIADDTTTTHAIVDGTRVDMGTRTPVQLQKTQRTVHATYVASNSVPGFPSRSAYWLIIDDM
ncbi:MAG: hypothetical protein JST22_01575 [Bacteroidetes bacterium]|nr:hypothetical protein [Bacteroidota bacterium]